MNVLCGDVRARLQELPDESVQCCVTSPPYWGLRDYGVPGQLGLERTPEEYVEKMVEVFREVRRVLKQDGTLWLNLGDSYTRPPAKGGSGPGGKNREWYGDNYGQARGAEVPVGLKPKDLVGIPWRVAFALQADGWYLRQDIIWHKPNVMPESVTDRCTKAHEYLFLLSKSERYYYDHEAVKEPAVTSAENQIAKRNKAPHKGQRDAGMRETTGGFDKISRVYEFRNRRSVWTVATAPYRGAHFATFPTKLIEPCILAGSREGDTVLDPFAGAGTTLLVSQRLNRKTIGVELNPAYVDLIHERLREEVFS